MLAGEAEAATAPTIAWRTLGEREAELLPQGTRVGDYVVDRAHGSGGFATVYRGAEVATGREVAIKVLHVSHVARARTVTRFVREARALARVRHPGVVQLLDAGELPDGRPYLVLEWIEGRSLLAELRDRGRMTAREAAAVIREIGGALQAAHRVGVIHRDLSAANVIAQPAGDWFRCRVVDFGVAKLFANGPEDSAESFTHNTILGTPVCMAPEQILHARVDGRADVYALGVLLFSMLAGRPPYLADNPIELEEMHLYAPIPRASDYASVPQAMDRVVARALAKDPDDRYATVHELMRAARRAARARVRDDEVVIATTSAVALHVQASITPGYETDDGAFDELETTLQLAQQVCRDCRLTLVTGTANAAFAVAPGAAPRQRARVLRAAVELLGRLRAQERVTVTATVHAGELTVDELRHPVGGPLLRLADWIVPGDRGVHATSAAVTGLERQFALRPALGGAWAVG